MGYAKALVAALIAGVTAAGPALQDGSLNGQEIGVLVGAVLTAFGVTWRVPNKPPQ